MDYLICKRVIGGTRTNDREPEIKDQPKPSYPSDNYNAISVSTSISFWYKQQPSYKRLDKIRKKTFVQKSAI